MVAMMILVAVLSRSSTFPSLIWNGRFYLTIIVLDMRTYCWGVFGYHNSSPKPFLGYRVCRYHFPFGWEARFRGWRISINLCNPCRPWALCSILFIWSCTADRQRWIHRELLVDIHKLSAGLLFTGSYNLSVDVAHSEMSFLADFDYLLADLFCCFPLFEQMVALHYKQRIKYNRDNKYL